MAPVRLSQHQSNALSASVTTQAFTKVCFVAAGLLVLMQLNAEAGVKSAVAAILPQKVMVSATSASSQMLTGSLSSYYNQSKDVLRKCPWLAEQFSSET